MKKFLSKMMGEYYVAWNIPLLLFSLSTAFSLIIEGNMRMALPYMAMTLWWAGFLYYYDRCRKLEQAIFLLVQRVFNDSQQEADVRYPFHWRVR